MRKCTTRSPNFIECESDPLLRAILHSSSEEDEEAAKRLEDDSRRIKSAAGRRLIPVHKSLIGMGFINFVEGRKHKDGSHQQVFREIEVDRWGYFSGALSKVLNRLIEKAGAKSRLRSTYSFRHNFSDACDAAGMPERVKNKLMGHQLEGAPVT